MTFLFITIVIESGLAFRDNLDSYLFREFSRKFPIDVTESYIIELTLKSFIGTSIFLTAKKAMRAMRAYLPSSGVTTEEGEVCLEPVVNLIERQLSGRGLVDGLTPEFSTGCGGQFRGVAGATNLVS